MGVGIKRNIRSSGRLRIKHINPFKQGYYLYCIGSSGGKRYVYQYYLGDLSDPYNQLDLTQIQFVSQLELTSPPILYSIAVGNNGQKMYLSGRNDSSNTDYFIEYDLPTQLVQDAQVAVTIQRGSSYSTSHLSIDIKPDGTHFYTRQSASSPRFYDETLSPAWSLANLPTYYPSGTSDNPFNPRIKWNNYGTRMYSFTISSGSPLIHSETVSPAWGSTFNYYRFKDVSGTFFSIGRGYIFPDDKTLILPATPSSGAYPNAFYVGKMTTSSDVSTLTFDMTNRYSLPSSIPPTTEIYVSYVTPV